MQDYLSLNRSPVCFCWYYMMAVLTRVLVSNRNFKTILFAFRWKPSLAATLPIAPMKSSFCAVCILSLAVCHAVLFLDPLLSAAFGIHGSLPQVSFYNPVDFLLHPSYLTSYQEYTLHLWEENQALRLDRPFMQVHPSLSLNVALTSQM